jgi:hypothetical protein
VWTSAGVVIGVTAVGVTGWETLDPLIALAVAANIVVTGVPSCGAPPQGSWTMRYLLKISQRSKPSLTLTPALRSSSMRCAPGELAGDRSSPSTF